MEGLDRGGRRGRSEKRVEEHAGGERVGVENGQDHQGCEYGKVEGEGEEHPFGGLAGEDAAGVEGGVFEHGASLDQQVSARAAHWRVRKLAGLVAIGE